MTHSKPSNFFFVIIQLFSIAAFAGPADYVFTPNIDQGEKEISFKYGFNDKNIDIDHVAKVGFGFAPTNNWMYEINLSHQRANGSGESFLEIENKFRLTDEGKHPYEIGFIQEVGIALQKERPNELSLGPMFQYDYEKFRANTNFLFEREFGSNPNHEDFKTDLKYQTQVKYRYMKQFEFGLQGFGTLGEWDHWDKSNQQDHRWGPMISGKFKLSEKDDEALKYDLGILFGLTDASPNLTLRSKFVYIF
jgi:hypothetical protein